jgi:hypothetical protein
VTDHDIRTAYQELARLQQLCSQAYNQYALVCEQVLTSAEGSDVALAHRETLEELPSEVGASVHEAFRFFFALTYEAVIPRRKQHREQVLAARTERDRQRAERLARHAAELGFAAADEEAANPLDPKAAEKAKKKGKRLRDKLRNLLPM